ncbi:hypothetical protein [Phenylobacterium sp.]|jgi:hypothetical protein|uniref:hypothetical protein n=1 Tax=Phenylobacterium sp. TaxID=1871053 RepID=UPI002F93CD6B
MRPAFGAALACILTLAFGVPASAQQALAAKTERATSAQRFAQPASYQGPVTEKGYSARQRRIADCLATYPGYDPRTDRIQVAPGVTRACVLQVAEARR